MGTRRIIGSVMDCMVLSMTACGSIDVDGSITGAGSNAASDSTTDADSSDADSTLAQAVADENASVREEPAAEDGIEGAEGTEETATSNAGEAGDMVSGEALITNGGETVALSALEHQDSAAELLNFLRGNRRQVTILIRI